MSKQTVLAGDAMAVILVATFVLMALVYALLHAAQSDQRLPEWFHDAPAPRGFPVICSHKPDAEEPADE